MSINKTKTATGERIEIMWTSKKELFALLKISSQIILNYCTHKLLEGALITLHTNH